MVFCKKLQKELPGLTFVPFEDTLGKKIFREISAQAWQMWLEHSKMLINEYRLDLATIESYTFLHEQCEKYFFGDPGDLPTGYRPV